MKPLHELARMFAPGDAALIAALDQADDPWEALGEGLEARKKLWRIDWKTFPSDVLWSLDQILPADKTRWAWCDLDRYEDDKTTEQFLRIVGTALAASDIGLVGVDQGSDEYWVTTLPFAKVIRALALAKQAKLGTLQSFSPKTKPPPPKPLPPPKKQPKTRRAKQFRARNCDLLNDKHSHAPGMVFEKGENIDEIWVAEVGDSWPPKPRTLYGGWIGSVAWAADGTHVIDANKIDDGKPTGEIVLVTGTKRTVIPPPGVVSIERFAFAGDQLVLFPTSYAYRGKDAKTPLQRSGKRWVPVPGLPAIKVPPPGAWHFAIQGVVHTAEGVPVIVWGGKGYERAGAKWVARYDLGKCSYDDVFPYVPAPNGFYFVAKGELRFVARDGKARRRLSKVDRIEWICAGPDNSIVVAIVRKDGKAPAGYIYFPDTDEVATIPATAFGLGREDWLEIVHYHPALDLVVGLYEADYSHATMAPVYGASLLALPRRTV